MEKDVRTERRRCEELVEYELTEKQIEELHIITSNIERNLKYHDFQVKNISLESFDGPVYYLCLTLSAGDYQRLLTAALKHHNQILESFQRGTLWWLLVSGWVNPCETTNSDIELTFRDDMIQDFEVFLYQVFPPKRELIQ